MRILLSIDDSNYSEAALQMVIEQNRRDTTEIRVLHILEPLAAFFPSANYQPPPPESATWDTLQKQLAEKGHALVAKAVEALKAAGLRAEGVTREGFPRTDIVDMAAEWRADLIVLGAHGRRGMERLLMGSVSEFVTRHAKCSVQIVRLSGTPQK